MVTSGQFFTLLFVCRLSLTILYSSRISGIISLKELILPLMISAPIMLLMLIPELILIGSERKNTAADIKTGIFCSGKTVSLFYGSYFLLSAVYGILTMIDFMNDILPEGVNAKILLSFLIAGCIYAAVKGVEAVSRMSLIVLMLFILAAVILALYLFPGYSSSRLIPADSLFSFSVFDGVVFMISRMNAAAAIGVFSENIKGSLKKGTVFFIFLSMIFTLFSVILMSGSAGGYLDKQNFQIFRSIDASSVLQRIVPFFILVAVCSIFCEITLFIIAASKCLTVPAKKLNEKTMSFLLGAVLIIIIVFLPSENIHELFFRKYLWGGAAVLFVTIVPALILTSHKLRRKNKRKKRIIPAAVIGMTIAVTVFISGCSKIQLNNRIIVQGIGIDKTAEGYKLTVIELDTDDPKKENTVRMVYSEGVSVEQAVISLEQQRGRKLLLAQCMFITMNKPASVDNKNTLEYFAQTNNIPKSLDLITTEIDSEQTLDTAINKLGYRSEDISALFGSSAVEQNDVKCTLLDYISRYETNAADLSFPVAAIDYSINALKISGSIRVSNEDNISMK